MPGMKKTMGEYKRGTLKSGSGKKVTSRKQAIAIAMSEAGAARKSAKAKSSPAKRKAPSEDSMWSPMKTVKKSAREMSALNRKRAQAGRLTAEQRKKVTQRDKAAAMEKRAKISRRRFKESM